MRLLIITIIAALFTFSAPSWAEGARFFTVLDDIPVMAGLEELPNDSTLFDTPAGRVADVSARIGRLNAHEIRSFYDTTLLQLGWTKIGDRMFSRDDERLTLSIDNGVLHLSIAPLK